MATGEAISWRIADLEKRYGPLDAAVEQQGLTLARHEAEIKDTRQQVSQVAATMNKAIWALVGFALTIASSAVAIAFTLGAHP